MRTEFVAEFTTNHMGNLNLLLEMVVKAKESGASLIKMQKKDVKTFYTKEKLEREYLSPYGKTYLDYRKIFEFNQEDFLRMDLKCKEIGIDWFSTVQDIPSLEFLLPFDLSTFKIASSRSKDIELLSAIRSEVPKETTIRLC